MHKVTKLLFVSSALLLSQAHALTLVKVASLSPLSGPSSDQGTQIRNGAQLAVLNAKAEFAKMGLNLQFVAYDDQADPATGTSNARRIASDKTVMAIAGTQNSGVIIPASEAVSGNHLAFVSPTTTNPKVTDRGLKNVNRICARDDAQGPAGADFIISKLKAKKVYMINDKTAYGQGLATEAEKALKAKGAQIVGSEGTEEKSDFSSIVQKIQLTKPDVVYFSGLYGQIGVFAKQLREKGIALPLVGGDGLDSPELIKIAGNGAKNIYFTTIAPPLEILPSAKAINTQYTAANKTSIQGYGIMGYDSALVILQGIRDAYKTAGNKAPTREQVETALRTTVTKGLTGEIRFGSNGDRTEGKMYIRHVGDDLKTTTAGVITVKPK